MGQEVKAEEQILQKTREGTGISSSICKRERRAGAQRDLGSSQHCPFFLPSGF